jgi:hypothetical protein
MSKRVIVTASLTAEPPSGLASGQSTLGVPTNVQIVCKATDDQSDIPLESDSARTINFGGGVTTAHVVKIAVRGGYVTARLTSASGTSQIVVIEPEMMLISKTIGYTALTLQRPAGVQVYCDVTLGEKS